MALEEKLCHTIDIVDAQSLNVAGEVQRGAKDLGVKCFIQGSNRRVLTSEGKELQADFIIVFDKDQDLTIGDEVENGFDQSGKTEILPIGRMVRIRDLIHPYRGRIARSVDVVRN